MGDEKTDTKAVFKSKGNFILKKCKSRTQDGFDYIVKIVPEEKCETERALLRLPGGSLGDEKTETKTVFKSKDIFIPKKCKSGRKDGFDNIVKMDKEPIKLTGATIFCKVGGQGGGAVAGALEAHVDGFIFTTSSSHIYMQFTFKNVKIAFFRVEDGRR